MSTEEILARHMKRLMELAQALEIYVPEENIYKEVVSGSHLSDRPQMQAVLERVYAGNVDGVLCLDIDRLGRGDMSDQGTIFNAFRLTDTLIITPEKTYDLSNDEDIMTTEFKAFFARAEWRMIRKRMQRGLMDTIRAGGYTANPPYGYRPCTIDKLPSLEIVEAEAHFVRYAYERYLSGIGAQTIAAELNERGSVPRRKSSWQRSTIRNLLRNPTYAGKIAWNRVKRYPAGLHGKDRPHVVYMPEEEWILVDGKHDAIIPYEQWQLAQRRRKDRYIPPSNHGQVANPFRGLIECGFCGARMQRMGDNKGAPYLLCTTTGCCAGAKFEYVEERFIVALEDELKKLRLEQAEQAKPDVEPIAKALAAIGGELKKLEARRPKLYELLEDGVYDQETFMARREALQEEQRQLLEKQRSLQAELDRIKSRNTEQMIAQLDNVLSLYPTLTPAEANQMLKPLIAKAVYTKYKKTQQQDFTLKIYLQSSL